MITRQQLERIFKLWFGQQRRERGDNFATIDEMKALCSDPLAYGFDMLSQDAFDLLNLVYQHDVR